MFHQYLLFLYLFMEHVFRAYSYQWLLVLIKNESYIWSNSWFILQGRLQPHIVPNNAVREILYSAKVQSKNFLRHLCVWTTKARTDKTRLPHSLNAGSLFEPFSKSARLLRWTLLLLYFSQRMGRFFNTCNVWRTKNPCIVVTSLPHAFEL